MKALLCIILTLTLLSFALTAQAKRVDHWYIKHNAMMCFPILITMMCSRWIHAQRKHQTRK